MRKSILAFLGGMLLALLLACSGRADIISVSGSADIKPLPGQVDPYKTRSELLMQATSYTGVTTPEQAATVWATGTKKRSAALQYTVMTERLKEIYASQLDAINSNWVTGESSPWVDSFTITNVVQTDSGTTITLRFETTDSSRQSNVYHAKLQLVEQQDFWRIDDIEADEGLSIYMI